MGANLQSVLPSLLSNAQFGLPTRFPFVFEAPDASGKKSEDGFQRVAGAGAWRESEDLEHE